MRSSLPPTASSGKQSPSIQRMHEAPISVVIPARNAAAFIETAIRSVQAQIRKVAEIIVVADDCSDRTAEIAAAMGTTVLRHNKRNMSVGLNLGVAASTQPWIAFLDADDFWNERKIDLQWQTIKSCPKAALISCDTTIIHEEKVIPPPTRYLRERWANQEFLAIDENCVLLESVTGDFLTEFFIATPTVIVRRDVFETVGFVDESLRFGQTLEFFARVLARYPFAFIEESLVYQRFHEHNHTKDQAGYWASYVSIVDQMLKKPELYPPGTGLAHRDYLKANFLEAGRLLAQQRSNG